MKVLTKGRSCGLTTQMVNVGTPGHCDVQPQDNRIKRLIRRIERHDGCQCFVESPTHYTVIYPDGCKPYGVRVDRDSGDRKVLKRIYRMMDRHWIASLFWRK